MVFPNSFGGERGLRGIPEQVLKSVKKGLDVVASSFDEGTRKLASGVDRRPKTNEVMIDGKKIEVPPDLKYFADLSGKKSESIKFIYDVLTGPGEPIEVSDVVDNRNAEAIPDGQNFMEYGSGQELLTSVRNEAKRIAINLGRPVEIIDNTGLVLYSYDGKTEGKEGVGSGHEGVKRVEGWDRIDERKNIEGSFDYRNSELHFAREAATSFIEQYQNTLKNFGSLEEAVKDFLTQNDYFEKVPVASIVNHLEVGAGEGGLKLKDKGSFIDEELERVMAKKSQ